MYVLEGRQSRNQQKQPTQISPIPSYTHTHHCYCWWIPSLWLDQGKEVVAPPVQAAIATEAAAYGCLGGTHEQGMALEVYFGQFWARTTQRLWMNSLIWLVVWNINFIFPYIGNVIIPIDCHIFQRGGPTTNQYFFSLLMENWDQISIKIPILLAKFLSMSFLPRPEAQQAAGGHQRLHLLR